MIVGIGTDIARIARIREAIARHAGAFLSHIFTEEEQAEADGRKSLEQYYAGRWAGKEALSKALGCGIGEKCLWLDIKIMNNADGQPQIFLSGKTAETAEKLSVKNIHISISHEKKYACSTVVLES